MVILDSHFDYSVLIENVTEEAIVSEMNKGQNEKNIRCTYLILQGKEILKSHYGKMNYLFNLCDTHYTYNILSSYF